MADGDRVAGSAALTLVTGVTPLREAESLFEAMLSGWQRQQHSRRLGESIIGSRERTVRRFVEFSEAWPWQWAPGQVEEWIAQGGWAHSTVRSYQGALAVFLDYVCDPRYGWVAECEQRVGARPVQVVGEWNAAVHVADYEGQPERRALTRAELQAFFDAADDRVERVSGAGRKGQLGRLGVCQVRYGKAMRGSPPRRRAVLAVMPWAIEALEQYLEEVRPRYAAAAHPALWLTERGGRISTRQVDDRFALWRAAAGLPTELSVHCLRHSYLSHLAEDGADPLFLQQQAGHSWASTTAIYTHVGADAKNRMLQRALRIAFYAEEGERP